jgi:hypothetical protein
MPLLCLLAGPYGSVLQGFVGPFLGIHIHIGDAWRLAEQFIDVVPDA